MALLATYGHPYEAELDSYSSLSFTRKKGEKKTQSSPGRYSAGSSNSQTSKTPVLYLEDSLPLLASLFLCLP